jgi:hypothetical protein
MSQRGGARVQARAFLEVALDGIPAERPRAALLWGLYACDAPSPRSALRAFSIAAPTGGRARLAARRLEDALGVSHDPSLWLEAGAAAWLPGETARRFRLRAGELFVATGQPEVAAGVLPPLDALVTSERGRALAVLAAGAGGEAARRRLAVEFPQQFVTTYSRAALTALEPSFTTAEWTRRADALLDTGDAGGALGAARHAGAPAALTAARAALRLRHPSEAIGWADRLGARSAAGALERAEALRQLAWAGPLGGRPAAFARLLAAARSARDLAAGDAVAAARADVLAAEALTELHRDADAEAAVVRGFDRAQPRWEWVWRRLLLSEGERRGPAPALDAAIPTASSRLQRLAAFWRARRAARDGDGAPLRALATGGLPDLPGLWAAQELHAGGVAVELAERTPLPPAPPVWSADLLALGRVSDVIVAWRAELEADGSPGVEWLGLVHLADMQPLDAIPLLVRGEPRLLAGPWSGLPRSLLQRYLPLPWRSEVEAASRRAGVPPWLLAGLVRQESAWNQHARSTAGAVGLAQVLPSTGLEMGRTLGLRIASAADVIEPANNLLLGAALLTEWRRSFTGSWTAGLAAYNGGERRVREIWERAGARDGPEFVEALEVPETWDYVHRVVLLAEGYRLLYWPEGRPYPWM